MNELAERLMAEVRVRLGQANLCERRAAHIPPGKEREQELEIADAYGAVAGNKIERVLRITCPPLVPRWGRK